ncbi:hypothetical protein PR048_026119 [Dryococelus australis]|uniref:Uncharacterized protein n=1 Tax=Dryococelus australis TaxID=614101 RepID=A0ABQ9GKH9_9NEOP|nr:hypothetical protein PR048_026119 [Dryococelus australis]
MKRFQFTALPHKEALASMKTIFMLRICTAYVEQQGGALFDQLPSPLDTLQKETNQPQGRDRLRKPPSASQRSGTWTPKRRTNTGYCKAGPGIFPHPTSSQGRSQDGRVSDHRQQFSSIQPLTSRISYREYTIDHSMLSAMSHATRQFPAGDGKRTTGNYDTLSRNELTILNAVALERRAYHLKAGLGPWNFAQSHTENVIGVGPVSVMLLSIPDRASPRTMVLNLDWPMRYPLHHDDDTTARVKMSVLKDCFSPPSSHSAVETMLKICTRLVRLFASHQGEPGPIPGRETGFSHAGIVPDDAVGRRVFSGISRFPRLFHLRRRCILTSITLIGSQGLSVTSRTANLRMPTLTSKYPPRRFVYTQNDEISARQFKSLLVVAKARFMRASVSPLSLPRVRDSDKETARHPPPPSPSLTGRGGVMVRALASQLRGTGFDPRLDRYPDLRAWESCRTTPHYHDLSTRQTEFIRLILKNFEGGGEAITGGAYLTEADSKAADFGDKRAAGTGEQRQRTFCLRVPLNPSAPARRGLVTPGHGADTGVANAIQCLTLLRPKPKAWQGRICISHIKTIGTQQMAQAMQNTIFFSVQCKDDGMVTGYRSIRPLDQVAGNNVTKLHVSGRRARHRKLVTKACRRLCCAPLLLHAKISTDINSLFFPGTSDVSRSFYSEAKLARTLQVTKQAQEAVEDVALPVTNARTRLHGIQNCFTKTSSAIEEVTLFRSQLFLVQSKVERSGGISAARNSEVLRADEGEQTNCLATAAPKRACRVSDWLLSTRGWLAYQLASKVVFQIAEEYYATCMQVDLQQGSQKRSFYREQPAHLRTLNSEVTPESAAASARVHAASESWIYRLK